MNNLFGEFLLNIVEHLADKLSGYWNMRLYWRVSQAVGSELKSYSERKPFWTWSADYRVELQIELLRSNSRLGSLIILWDAVHTMVEVCRMDLWNDLGFSLCAMPSVCCIVTISDDRKKSKMEVSADLVCHCWTLEIEFNKNYLCWLSD